MTLQDVVRATINKLLREARICVLSLKLSKEKAVSRVLLNISLIH